MHARLKSSIGTAGLLVTCTFGMGASLLSLGNYAMGAFVYPLTQAFGWSRAEVTLGYSVLTVVTLFTSFAVGWLADVLPPRRFVVPAQIAYGLGFMALGLFATADLNRYYALHLLLAILAAGALPITFSRITAARFMGNRGLAIGVISTGSGFCGLLVPPYLALLVEHFGWRGAYVGLGLVPIAGALLLSLPFLPREAPRVAAIGGGARPVSGITLAQAVRGHRLWVIAATLALGSGLAVGVVSNLIPLLRDAGMSPVAAAGALSVLGLSVIAGRVLTGFLLDRYWAAPVALAVMSPAAVALLVLAFVPVTAPLAYVCAAVIGVATGAEGDLLWYLGARYFGLAHVGRIYAFLFIWLTIGVGVGAPLFGAVYDRFGSYDRALTWGALAWVLSAAILLTLGRYPAADAEPAP